MSAFSSIASENILHNSEIPCDQVITENTVVSDHEIVSNAESEEISLSNSDVLCELVNNENLSDCDNKLVTDSIENEESSPSYTESGISSTTSPLVLYLRPEDHTNEESSENVLPSKSNNNERPFSCYQCDKTFKRRAHLNVHLHTHNEERPHVCKKCNKAFAHHSFLKNHELLHNTVKEFTCEFCNEEFSVRRYYVRHIRNHAKRRYECDLCDFFCYRLKESIIHAKDHGDNVFVCDKCDRHFGQELSLNLHHCFASDIKRFSCTLCPKTFRRHDTFQFHMAKHENKKSFVCEICTKGFNTKNSLIAHTQIVHKEDDESKPYSCQTCAKKFHLEVNAKRHELGHRKCKKPQYLSENTFPVSEYQSRVNRQKCGALVGYINVEGPVPMQQPVFFIPGKKINHVCNICLKGFSHRHSLTVHLRRHTGQKPFKCEVCDWRFADKLDLKRHCRTHSTDLKYACDACGTTFTRRANMNVHKKNSCHGRRKALPKIQSVFSLNEESS